MKVKEISIADIIPYENNPRKNDVAVDPVANSIKRFGFKVPIVIDKENVIVTGHTRFKAALKLGLEKVPCVVADDLTEEEIKAFRIADNKTGELAGWDFAMLDLELDEINDIDMSEFGFIDASEYNVDDFFNQEVEHPKENQKGIKLITDTEEQAKEAFDILTEAGFNPVML